MSHSDESSGLWLALIAVVCGMVAIVASIIAAVLGATGVL